MTIWFKNNKAAEKYPKEDIIKVLQDTLAWIEDNNGDIIFKEDGVEPAVDILKNILRKPIVKLKTQVELYMLKTHGVSHETCRSWMNEVHINNKSITGLWSAILLTLETRMVYDKELRPSIQGMVLQNKHDYREKKDISADVKFSKMPKVMIGDKELDIEPQEDKDGD